MPPSSTRQWPAITLGVLIWEMFLTTPVLAAQAPATDATPAASPATPDSPGPAPATGPEGQVDKNMTVEPAATPQPPSERATGKRAPPDPDVPAAPSRLGAGGELRLHGGVHAPVVGAAIAFDWALRRASIGAGVDYAAWIDVESLRVSAGALGLFALVIHRIPLGRINLRQRAGVGPAFALQPIGAHKAGNVGLFFEVAPLGLEIQTRVRRLAVTFDAFSLAISAPVLGKDTYAVFQYRAALGLRF